MSTIDDPETESSTPPTFRDWLAKQVGRDDPIGDLAHDALGDRQWTGDSVESLRVRMAAIACHGVLEALDDAARRYRRHLAWRARRCS